MSQTKVIYYVIVVLIVIGAIYYASIHNWNEYKLPTIDRQLPAEAIAIYQTRLNEGQSILDEARAAGDFEKEYGALHNIAAQYYGLGDLTSAFEFYSKAALVMPDSHVSYKEMSKVMNEGGNYEKALEYINKAIELKPDSPDSWILKLTLTRAHVDDTYEGLDATYQEAILATNQSINILTLYARFLEEQGQIDFALKAWYQLAAMVVENELFIEEIKRLEELMPGQ